MTLKLNGSTDGSVSLDAPADTSPTGTDITLTLPTTVGSADQFVKNGGTAGELEYSSMVETSTGDVQARRARSNTAGDVALSVQPSDSSIHYGLRIDAANNNLNLDRVSGTAANLLAIDSSGRLLVGPTTARSNILDGDGGNTLTPYLQVETANDDTAKALSIIYGRNNTNGAEIVLGKHRNASVGGTTVVSHNDQLGSLTFSGSDGTNFIPAATIEADVDATPGTNDMPGRLVFSTTADGASSPSTRMVLLSTGRLGLGMTAPAGQFHVQQNSGVLPGMYLDGNNGGYSATLAHFRVSRGNNSGYGFLACQSAYTGSVDNEFYLRGDGNGYADDSWNGGGADYAEYFEWSDGNTEAEDRRGISVVLDGDKIREAVDGEEPIGVISGNPSVVGDAGWNKWSGKYLRDDYGSYVRDENGHRQLSADFDPDLEYVPREDRPEWDTVGLMGKLRIRKGQVTGARWIKMRDVSDTVEEWLVR